MFLYVREHGSSKQKSVFDLERNIYLPHLHGAGNVSGREGGKNVKAKDREEC